MRLGIIDLGTNSIRFDAYEMRQKKPLLLHRERLMVRLGSGVFLRGNMSKEAVTRTVQAFVSFNYTASQLGVNKIVAVATSALRQASNRDKLMAVVKRRTGIDVRVISGEEEARFIARGIMSRERNLPQKLALLDIGGGSAEISFFRKRQIAWAASFPLGIARIEQLFRLNEAGISVAQRRKRVKDLRKHIKAVFKKDNQNLQWSKIGGLLGSSGTIKALLRLQHPDAKQRNLSRLCLKALIHKMIRLNQAELLKIPRMDLNRVDMILGGAVILDEIMSRIGVSKIRFTEFALREGVLDEEADLIRDAKDSSLAHHLGDLEVRLRSSLADSSYARRIVSITEELFDSLYRLHRLGRNWKAYLSAAAMLQNTGKVISPAQHHIHSFYIVNNLDFPWLDKLDRNILSHLCLWHANAKIGNKNLGFLPNTILKKSFLKALAILQIANALVWYDRAPIKLLRSQLRPGQVQLKLAGREAQKLLCLRIEARSKLFSRVFKRNLVLNSSQQRY